MMTVKGTRGVASVLVALFNGLWYLLAAALVIAICVTGAGWPLAVQFDADGGPNIVVGANAPMAIPVAFRVDSSAVRARSVSLGVGDAEIQDAHGVLRFPPPRGSWVAVAVVVLMFSLGLWVIAQVRALFRNMRDGKPFAAANVTRVRRLAYAVIAGEVARAALLYFANHYAATNFSADGISFSASPHLNAFAIVDGLILLALAEVFRAGRQLEDDQSLTV